MTSEVSAFGVVHLSKRERKSTAASGSAIAGAGSVAAGAGLVGGGIPGVRSNSETIAHMREGSWAQRTGAALSSGRGGIFGYRTDAHQKALNHFKAEEQLHAKDRPNMRDSFMRGRGAGKIGPEKQVIQHMKRGRAASNVLLGAGAATAAYGVYRAKKKNKVSKAQRDSDKFHGALLGAGGATAAGSMAAQGIMSNQAKKWKAREQHSLAQAERVNPNVKAGMSSDTIYSQPQKSFGPWWKSRNPRNKGRQAAEEAGRWRGKATQQHYFSSVYAKHVKAAKKVRNPALAAAAVGGTGLLLSRKDRR